MCGSAGVLLGEVLATAGLLALIGALTWTGNGPGPAPCRPGSVPPTSSPPRPRSANPAVTIGRAFTDSFSGIAPVGRTRSSPRNSSGGDRRGIDRVLLSTPGVIPSLSTCPIPSTMRSPMTDKPSVLSSACTTPDARRWPPPIWPISARPHRGAVRWSGARRQRQPISRRRHGGRGIEHERGDPEDSDERGRRATAMS